MKHIHARRFIYKVRGDSQSSIIEASDGAFYVLKLAQESHPNLFFNEAFGAALIRHFQLPVAEWMPVLLTDAFIGANPALWTVGNASNRRPYAGLHFGSRLITSKCGIGAFQLIPSRWLSRVNNSEDFARILALDIWTNHCDRRQAIFTSAVNDMFHATFMDNGHMFGGPDGEDVSCPRRAMMHDLKLYRSLPVAAILEEWRRRISAVSREMLMGLLAAIPTEWYSLPMAEKAIAELLSRRSKLPSLYAEAADVIRTGASASVEQFVTSIEARV